MRRKRSRRNGVALGFVLTVALLSGLAAALYVGGSGVPSLGIPESLPAYGGMVSRYAPSDALQVSFDNLTAIRALNQSALPQRTLLALDQPPLSIGVGDLEARLTVVLSKPNATVDVGLLTAAAYERLGSALASSSAPTQAAEGFTFYAVAETGGARPTQYWLTLLPGDRAVAFASGDYTALQGLERVVGVYRGSVPSLLSQTWAARMLYTVGGASGHLALGIQNFPGVVRTGQATLIAVDSVQGSVEVSYSVRFSDASQASSQLPAVRSAYLSAHQLIKYDEVVKAIEVDPAPQLTRAVALVG